MDPWVYAMGVDPHQELARCLGRAQLPSFPALQIRILDTLRDPDAHTSRLVELIAADPGLTVQLLRAVNTAAFGAPGRVSSVSQAVRLVGRLWIEHLVVALTARRLLHLSVPGRGVRDFWAAAALRAAFAEGLAEQILPEQRALCFTAALLQDMAMPLLVEHGGMPYAVVLSRWNDTGRPLQELEREHLGWDHADVALWLAASWGLPAELCQALGGHHGATPRSPTAPLPVRIADRLDDVPLAIEMSVRAGLPAASASLALASARARHGELMHLLAGPG